MDYYICRQKEYRGIDISIVKKYGLNFPDAYTNTKDMYNISKEIKKRDNSLFCVIPFCNTVESEAFGANINLGDEINGPRSSKLLCNNIEEVYESFKNIDFTKGRIQKVLSVINMLKNDGENIVLNLSGPLTILNNFIELNQIFSAIKKKNEKILEVFCIIKNNLLFYIEDAIKQGVSIISFSDPIISPNILGKIMTIDILNIFIIPFLKEVENKFFKKVIFHICPQITYSLLHYNLINIVERKLDNEITYEELIVKYKCEKTMFLGLECINNSKNIKCIIEKSIVIK